jgi:hypothetical protein
MKNISEKLQLFLEHLLIVVLVAIIIIGSYQLYKKWTKEEIAHKPAKAHGIIDAPTKELCSFMMKQCNKIKE